MLKYLGILGILHLMTACATAPSEQSTSAESHANFALGVASFQSSNYSAAYNYFARAESMAPENSSYRMHTGLALMSLERHSEAEKKIISACEAEKEYPECWNNLAAFYLKTNRPKEALAMAQKSSASTSYRTPSVALANEARALIALKRYRAALVPLSKADRIGQATCDVSLLHAQANNRLKFYDRALESARKAESMCSSNPNTHFWVAYLYTQNQRRDLAQAKYLAMLETFRDQKIVFQTNAYLQQLEKRIPLQEPAL